ncbi:MAG: DegV family protein [Oscillospiraceae bacterium]|nr:DegV family protein [Oscillospiraceae bacterium]
MIYKIVSDSSSNVFLADGVPFASAPLALVFNDKEYVDTPELDVDAMLDEMKETRARVTSSCPNVGQWLEAYDGADCVFALTITGALSGAYNSAMQAREEFLKMHPERRIHVFDTLSTGPEMRLIIEHLRGLILQNEEFDAIVESVNTYMKKTHLSFCLSSLDNLARAGRVSPVKAKFAGILGIRVIGKASDEGTLKDDMKVRGEDRALSALLRHMEENGFSGGKVRTAHTHNEGGAKKLCELIRTQFPQCDIQIEKNRALCSYYAEEGGILVGYEG